MKSTNNIRTICLLVILLSLIIAWIIVPHYFFKKGVSLFNQGKYFDAYKQFYNARLLDKTNSELKYYYVQTLAKFRPSYKIQKEIFAFTEGAGQDSAKVFASIQVNLWKSNIMQKYTNNYIEQAPFDNEIIRWNPSTFPLKVYISMDELSKKYPDYYLSVVTKAFGQWASSSGFLAFNFINKPAQADIVVKFTSLPENSCENNNCKYVVAHTVPTIKGNLLKQMTITIYDKAYNGSYFSDRELFNTVLHEIGHALGIMGHSYSTEDLMYMADDSSNIFVQYRKEYQHIALSDVMTLKLLYNLVPTITNTPISEIKIDNLIYPPVIFGNAKDMAKQKIKEAENYIKNAPELSGGYIDLGIAYQQAGELTKAIESFQKAYDFAKTNEDKFIILYDLAVVYLNQNKLETALSYANRAKELNANDDILELISNIEHALKTKSSPFKINTILN